MATYRMIKGRYYAYFYDRTKKPKEKSWPLRTSKESAARRKLAKLETRYEQGLFDPWDPLKGHDSVTAEKAIGEFLESVKDRRPKTIETYKYALNGLKKRLPPNLMVGHMERDHLAAHILDPDVSDGTKRLRYRHIMPFVNWAISRGYIRTSPLEGIRLPREEKRLPEYFTNEQVAEVLQAIDAEFEKNSAKGHARAGEMTWLKDVIVFAAHTGLRLRELVNLRWTDVDLELQLVRVRNLGGFKTKSGHERSVPLEGPAYRIVKQRHITRRDSDEDFVFTYGDGRQIVAEYMSKQFKRFVRKANLSEVFRFHSLRHTCASWLVQRGVPLEVVKEVLGHSGIRETERYAHLSPEAVRAGMRQAFGRSALRPLPRRRTGRPKSKTSKKFSAVRTRRSHARSSPRP